MVDFLLFGVVLGHDVRCTGKVVSRCPWRVFGALPDSGSKTRSDWRLSRHNVKLGGSVHDRDSNEAERDRTHDVRNVTQSVHVLEERKHAGRQGPFVSVACHYLGLALEHYRELASGRRIGWSLGPRVVSSRRQRPLLRLLRKRAAQACSRRMAYCPAEVLSPRTSNLHDRRS